MLYSFLEFLVLLNPFALFLYLLPVMRELDDKTFSLVLLKASLISFGIYLPFLFSGNFIFDKFFHINIESFRIFGGIIIFTFAFLFIVRGEKALIKLKGSLNDLASEVALPFMVGAGTISLVIFMGRNHGPFKGFSILFAVIIFNYFFIIFFKKLRDSLSKKRIRLAFDRLLDVMLRLNGFFVGAIGIDMIRIGISNLYGI